MTITTAMQTATSLTHGPRSYAPRVVAGMGSKSAFSTLGNPIFGTDAVARVRDAKPAAPPRGVLH
ncbi:MAG: hypothetical protein ACRDVG_03415 [Jatrophihabitantaceae bacterium]